MGVFEAIVVFVMAWWLVFLPSLSAGTQSQHEAEGDVVPGTDRGAPTVTRLVPKMMIATGAAGAVTLLAWLALHFGWLGFLIPKA